MRLLMEEPNVLLLDEPTNDLDIDTLRALEDLLDSWPGTLIAVSHDRYFVERVCDNVHALAGDGSIEHLPGGIEQYISAREVAAGTRSARSSGPTDRPAGAVIRDARKQVQRWERELVRLDSDLEGAVAREAQLGEQMAANSTDHGQLLKLGAQLQSASAERARLEARWLEVSEALEAASGR